MKSSLYNFFLLTKPRIMVLVLLTGAAGLSLEGSLLARPGYCALVLLALYLVSGSANSLNQYFERDIDALMSRTSRKRPLPTGRLSPRQALVFALVIGVAGVAIFALRFNLLSAALALFAVLFYGIYYTVWLKPRTHLNIVIGGAAGAMAPVIAWAAASGTLALTPLILFLIIFFWSPPHFWALALYLKEDYRKARLPMLPLVKGEGATRDQIFYYTLILFAVSLSLIAVRPGLLYAAVSLGLGGLFIWKAGVARKTGSAGLERGLFSYSIIYLCALFTALIIEGLV